MPRVLPVILAAAVLMVPGREARAQGDRIPLKFMPKPDQVIHMTIAQESQLEVEGAPVLILSTTRIGLTQKVGPRDERGGVTSVLTYDEFTAEATMNGNPVPVPVPNLAGHSFTVTFDANGAVSDTTASDPADAPLAGMARSMVEQLYRSGDGSIGVGESAVIPFTSSVSMPGLPPGTTTQGSVTMKLLSVDGADAERVAHFEQKTDVQSSGGPGGPGTALKMTGGGTLDWNIEHGYIKSMQNSITMDGEVMAQKLRGTLNTKVTGSN